MLPATRAVASPGRADLKGRRQQVAAARHGSSGRFVEKRLQFSKTCVSFALRSNGRSVIRRGFMAERVNTQSISRVHARSGAILPSVALPQLSSHCPSGSLPDSLPVGFALRLMFCSGMALACNGFKTLARHAGDSRSPSQLSCERPQFRHVPRRQERLARRSCPSGPSFMAAVEGPRYRTAARAF